MWMKTRKAYFYNILCLPALHYSKTAMKIQKLVFIFQKLVYSETCIYNILKHLELFFAINFLENFTLLSFTSI